MDNVCVMLDENLFTVLPVNVVECYMMMAFSGTCLIRPPAWLPLW